MKVVVAYFPVLHRGYIDFLKRHADAEMVFVLDRSVCLDLQPKLRKDVRSMEADEAAVMLDGLINSAYTGGKAVKVLKEPGQIPAGVRVVMPDEVICHEFAFRYLQGFEVVFDNVFLRWDGTSSTKPVDVMSSSATSFEQFDQEVMRRCGEESGKSLDWWRQIGGCVIRDDELIMDPAHNEHVPSPIQPYYDGDPRADFSKGQNIELTTAFHTELRLIAEAARRGISLEGAHLYVTTFPCPWCAKAVAYSGISRVYFEEGYSVLDAESILKSQDVELIRVVTEEPPE